MAHGAEHHGAGLNGAAGASTPSSSVTSPMMMNSNNNTTSSNATNKTNHAKHGDLGHDLPIASAPSSSSSNTMPSAAAAQGGSSVASSSSPQALIRDVWADNLLAEMTYLRELVEEYPYISMVSSHP